MELGGTVACSQHPDRLGRAHAQQRPRSPSNGPEVMLDGVTVRTDCSTLYNMQASECTFHLSGSWPSPWLQAGAAFLYYDQLASGNATAQRVNITCPPADWPAALAAAGATLAPCGTATACSGQELVDALTALQPAHERVLVTLTCNMTAPPMPRDAATGAPLPLQLYRNVTIAGRRDAQTELSVWQQLDYFELIGLEPSMVLADFWLPYAPQGAPSSWPRGLLASHMFIVKRSGRDNITDPSPGSRVRVVTIRLTAVQLPEHARYLGYWVRRLNSALDSERASAAWLVDLNITAPTVRVMDEDGMPTFMTHGLDVQSFGLGFREASLVQRPLPNTVMLWALEDPPVALSNLDWFIGNDAQDVGRQLLRLLAQQLPATGSDPRVILLASNVTLSSAWWPPGGVLLNQSVTISGPAGQAPVWLDMGGVLLLQANSSAKLSLRNLLVANMRAVPPNNTAASWMQPCGAPGLGATSRGSHQLHNCTMLLTRGLVDEMVGELQAAPANGHTSPLGGDVRSVLLGPLATSWDEVSSPGPGAVAVQQGWLLGLLLNTTTLKVHDAMPPAPFQDVMEHAPCGVAAAYSATTPSADSGLEESSGGGGCCSSAQAGAIAGGVIGGVLVLAAACGLLYAVMQRRHTHGLRCVGKPGEARAADGTGASGGGVCDVETCAAAAGTDAAPADDAGLAGASAANPPPLSQQQQPQQQHQQPGAAADALSTASASAGLVVQGDHQSHPTKSSDQGGGTTSSSRWTPTTEGPGVHTLSAITGPMMIDEMYPVPSPKGPGVPAMLDENALQHLLLASGSSGMRPSSEELLLEGIIGVGGGGIVHKGIWRGLVVAVKLMALPIGGSPLHEERRLREVALSDSLHHPNIVTTFHYDLLPLCMTSEPAQQQQAAAAPGESGLAPQLPPVGVVAGAGGEAASGQVVAYKLLVVQQLCEGGNLRQALSQGYFKQPDGSPYTVRAVLAALDIIQGLQHLHTCNVIHGDLTAANVLLKEAAASVGVQSGMAIPVAAAAEVCSKGQDDSGVAHAAPAGVPQHTLPHVFKIADFGMSVLLRPDQTHASGMRQGTMFYMAPEVAYRGHLSPAADVYGFGVMLWEMANARSVGSLRLPMFPAALGSTLLGACGPGVPGLLRQLISNCLTQEPKARPSAAEVKQQLGAILEDLMGSPEAAATLRSCTRTESEMRMTHSQAQRQQQHT